MPENNQQAGTPPDAGAPNSNNGQQGERADFSAWPAEAQAYIRELRQEAANNRRRAQELESAMNTERTQVQEREQQRLAAEGNFRALAEQHERRAKALEPYEARARALEEKIAAGNAARIANIPETDQSLVPKGLSPEDLAAWLDTNYARLTARRAPNLDGGAGTGGNGATALTDEQRAMAKRFGLTEEQYRKNMT